MLDLKFVLANLDVVRDGLVKRSAEIDLQPLVDLDSERRQVIVDVEGLKQERNEASKSIGQRIKAGEDVAVVREKVRGIGERIKELDARLAGIESEIGAILESLPNLPDPSCPVGADESANRTEFVWGEKPSFSFTVRDHVDMGEIRGTLDLERAAKLTGARFAVHFDEGARLKRALVNFMIDLHTGLHGYREVIPPFIVNRESLFGTGQLPKFEDDLFRLQNPSDWYLIPTAEVPITNLHRDEILTEEELPIKYVAFTPCFRAEAGSHGRDVRGLIRQHQFYKVELVTFSRPEDSAEILEQLTSHAEEVLKRLGLHYRRVTLATGDLGFSASKTYDLEVWLPSQDTFREISSCSNFRDFQARRAGIRYRPAEGGKPRFVHTLNGSGLAVGRTVVAILDQFQREDGSFRVPDVLAPYMETRIRG